MWGKVVLALRVSAAVWAGLVGLGVILQIATILPALPKLEPYVWGVSLGIIAIDNVGTLFVRKARTEREMRDKQFQSLMQTALRQLVASRRLRLEDLGANIYLARGWERLKETPKTARLDRVARYRPIDYPQQSGINWTDKTGTVGECWRMGRTTYKDWHAVAAKYGQTELDERGFFKIPADTRCGFTFREFQSIVGKYDEIVAEPIWHPRRHDVMVGVLTLDRAHQENGGIFVPLLGNRETYETIGLAARGISAILKQRTEENG